MKRFLGLDLSLTATGFCVLGEDASIESSGLIKAESKLGAARLVAIEQEVRRLVLLGMSDFVAIEGYSFGSFTGRERLGELGGVIRTMLYRMNIPFVEVPPTTLKKFVTGSGAAKKNVMLMSIYKKWGKEFRDDNVGDAYALARFIWSEKCDGAITLASYERQALNAVFARHVLT